MNRNIRKVYAFINTVNDLVLVSVAWMMSYYIRFYSPIPISKGIPNSILYFKLIPFILIIWFGVFTAAGLNSQLDQKRSPLLESFQILKMCFFATITFIAITFFYNEYKYSRLTLIIFIFLHPILLILGRSLIRKGARLYRKKADIKKVLIICSPSMLNQALEISAQSYIEPTNIVGVMHPWTTNMQNTPKLEIKGNVPIIPIPENWVEFFMQFPCELVVIAVDKESSSFIHDHFETIAEQITNIKVIPDLAKLSKYATGFDFIMQTPVITIHESPLVGVGSLVKRILDVIGAFAALLIFSPVILFISIINGCSRSGPIFYHQKRMGLDGKIFEIVKFRSMPQNVEKKTGAIWASKVDNRATPFGSFLRQTSLDELPQLLNVLKGDMSLVGPRPERPVFVNQFRKDIPGYMLRHKVKAGMTGLAQIKGWRGNTSIDKRIEYDLIYIQKWSIWLDIKILFLTIFRGFINPNAY